MSGRWLLLVVALAGTPAAAGINVPKTQVCKPAGLRLTYVLPADWACEGAPPYGNVQAGAKAGGMAPGFTVQLNVYTATAPAGAVISTYASRLAAGERAQLAQAPGVSVSSLSTTLGTSLPAVLVTAKYRGATVYGVQTLVRLDYFFIEGSRLYEFDYTGAESWIAKDLHAIHASAASIRFLAVA